MNISLTAISSVQFLKSYEVTYFTSSYFYVSFWEAMPELCKTMAQYALLHFAQLINSTTLTVQNEEHTGDSTLQMFTVSSKSIDQFEVWYHGKYGPLIAYYHYGECYTYQSSQL